MAKEGTGLKKGLKLVIFDCDGVLIDSEGPCCQATARFARSLGLDLSDDEALNLFAGKALPQVVTLLEARVGHALPEGTAAALRRTMITLMREEARLVDGAGETVRALHDRGVPFRVGSNSSAEEIRTKFLCTGVQDFFPDDRIHSANDRNCPKPSPDIYLLAAREEGVRPEDCVVIEDSDTGALAAHRAGMSCILLREAHHPLPDFWPESGFVRIGHLSELLPLLEPCLASSAEGRSLS